MTGIKDVVDAKDNVKLTLRDAGTGSIVHQSTHNAVTHPGEMFAIDRMIDRVSVSGLDTTTAYCAVGTGSVATNYWLGSLTTEISGAGNPGRLVPDSVSRSNQTVLVSTYYDTTEASGNITEAGLFVIGYDSGGTLQTASATKNSGVLFAYTTFNQVTKDTTNTLTLDWEVEF